MAPQPPPAPKMTRAQRHALYPPHRPLPAHHPRTQFTAPNLYSQVFVDTRAALMDMLSELNLSTTVPPHLFIDLQGNNLSRHGTISILTILDRSLAKVFLVDVHTLGAEAFRVAVCAQYEDDDSMVQAMLASGEGENPLAEITPRLHLVSLKAVLESEFIPKVLFDARNDSDALFALYGVEMRGVQDLQVMELATRCGRNRERVNGLAKCIQYGLMDALSPLQRSQIQTVKDRGAKLFSPAQGGSFEVFAHRPLDIILVHYCVQDVIHLPALWHAYNRKLRLRFWRYVVDEETKKRLEESRSDKYVPQGSHKSLGWTWEYLQQLELDWNA